MTGHRTTGHRTAARHMTSLADTFAQAVRALADHRLRTFLSVLGITIGIAAVMAVNTISKGGNHLVFSELETFGLNSAWVYRDWRGAPPGEPQRQGSGIDAEDVAVIRARAARLGVARLTPQVYPDDDPAITQGNRRVNANVSGVGRDFPDIVNDTLIAGRSFHASDIDNRHAVALLAPDVAADLLDPARAGVGQDIRIDGRRFRVIGLLGAKSRDFLSSIGSAGGQSANDRLLVPWTTLAGMSADADAVDSLQLEVTDFDSAQASAEAVRTLLERRHPDGFDYGVETMASYIVTTDRILTGVAVIGTVAASISLLVGGMGIMNMMGTAVLERTREIGVRKAIGATERDILAQFLVEAALISLAGGLLGLMIGTLASVALAAMTGFALVPSIGVVLGTLAVSILVGVLSGWLPARRAARMHPVEALRAD